ncbi:MAG: NAD(P)-dependent oxidoreductase [Polaromonas sp.]|nr:NAD(P)-dependent oxidoreductase [Polaromonas sp.]
MALTTDSRETMDVIDTSGPVGFIGLGAMGLGMAQNLLRKGYTLHVFARRPRSADAVVEAGAIWSASPQALGRACKLVVLSLPDAAAVEAVLFGVDGLADGLVDGLAVGSCVVDTSSIAATSARDFAVRLRARGIWLLDAPVSGGQPGAQAGTLGCMVGGPAPVLQACRSALESFCKTITHVGDVGAGQTVKACNQVAVAGALLGVADAMALATAQGVDPSIMREVLMGGAARSFSLEKHGPRIIAESFTPGFRAVLMRKDLRLALATAEASGAVLPSTAVAEELLDAMCADGRGDWDWCALALQVRKLSGQPLPAAIEPAVLTAKAA